jgi:S1-C subfamily serine protease
MYAHRVLTGVALCSLLMLSTKALAQAPVPKETPHAFLGMLVGPAPDSDKGVLVREVTPKSPADKAGVKSGDILMSVNDQKIKDGETFLHLLGTMKVGDKATLHVLRDGKEQMLTATLGERPSLPPTVRPGTLPFPVPSGARRTAVLGVRSEELTPEMKTRLNVMADMGAVVTEVIPDSAAAKAGLKADDVITAVNDKPMKNPEELRRIIQSIGPGKEITVEFLRGQEKMSAKAMLQSESVIFPPSEESSIPFPRFPMDQSEKIRDLERQVQTLEKRLAELEKKVNQPK